MNAILSDFKMSSVSDSLNYSMAYGTRQFIASVTNQSIAASFLMIAKRFVINLYNTRAEGNKTLIAIEYVK